MKEINDYPPILDLVLAVDLAISLFPQQYPDPIKTRNIIRINAKNGRVPGAKPLMLTGRKQAVWQYERDKLVEWLTNPAMHKPGRPVKERAA